MESAANQQPLEQQSTGGETSQQATNAAAASDEPAAATTATAEDASLSWTPTYIPLPVVDEKETNAQGHEVLVDINFADFIGKGSRTAKDDISQRHYLSSAYSYNSEKIRKNQIAPLFQEACARGGFDIISKGWEEHRQMIRFACQRSRLYKRKVKDEEEAKGDDAKQAPRNVIRPLTQTCPFNFSVYWEAGNRPGTGRWFVCPCGMGKCLHVGHSLKPWQGQEEAPKLSPHDVAFQQFMPQYQQFCILAASGDLYQMDYAGKLLQESIYKLQGKVPLKKRKRGRKPKVDKEMQFSSLQGVTLPYASLPPASLPPAPKRAASKKPKVAADVAKKPAAPKP